MQIVAFLYVYYLPDLYLLYALANKTFTRSRLWNIYCEYTPTCISVT